MLWNLTKLNKTTPTKTKRGKQNFWVAEGGLSFHPSSSELRQVLRHQAWKHHVLLTLRRLVRKTPKGPLSFPLGAGIQMVSIRKLFFWVSIWRMSNMCSSSQSQAAVPMPSCPCPPESPKAVSSLGDALPVSSSYKCIQNHCFTGIMAISYIYIPIMVILSYISQLMEVIAVVLTIYYCSQIHSQARAFQIWATPFPTSRTSHFQQLLSCSS